MLEKIKIATKSRTELIDITSKVEAIVRGSNIKEGVCRVFVPHTTAGVTMNENADPSVRSDILNGLEKMAPFNGGYEHAEGNSAAHIKATIVGAGVAAFVEGGKLALGTWQGVYFCEFDGPRSRSVFVKVLEG